MAEKKRQHFIPKFFFRFFSPDGIHLNLLHLKTGNIITNASIKEQCSQNNFYGSKDVEDAFELLENKFLTVLKECHGINSVRDLDQDKLFMLCEAAFFQKNRTLAQRERARSFQEMHLQLHAEILLNNDRTLSDSEKDKIRPEIKNLQPNLLFGHLLEIQTTLMAAVGLTDLALYILENKIGVPYIFSDAPVIFYNQFCEKIRYTGVLGCQSPGLQIFFPISPTRYLMLLDKSKYSIPNSTDTGILYVTSDDVAHLNKMQIHNAHELVYFHDVTNANYVKRQWKGEKKKIRSNDTIIKQAHSVAEQKSLLHTFAPMLSYTPKFSFLTYTPAVPFEQLELVRSRKLADEVQRLMDKVDKLNEKNIRRNQLLKPIKLVKSYLFSVFNRIKSFYAKAQ